METSITNAKKAYSKIGFSYGGMFIAQELLILLIMFVFKLVAGKLMDDGVATILDMVLRFALFYPLIMLLVKNVPAFEIPKKKLGVGRLIACLIIAYTIIYLGGLLGAAINSIAGKITGLGGVNPIADVIIGMSPVVQFVTVVILAPVFEELLFRKFLIDRVVNYGEVAAVLMSGFMFGLFHANLIQFVYATLLGLFFAYIYIRTGNIIYTILMHAFANGINTLLSMGLKNTVDLNEMMSYLNNGDVEGYTQFVNDNLAGFGLVTMFGFIIIGLVIAGIILMIVNRKKVVFEHHAEEIEKGKRFGAAVLNPGMIFYILFYVVMIIAVQLGSGIFGPIARLLGLV